MFKYLLLKSIFDVSDVNLLDLLIQKTVEIALKKEIIKSSAIIVDATHTKVRFNQKSPQE